MGVINIWREREGRERGEKICNVISSAKPNEGKRRERRSKTS